MLLRVLTGVHAALAVVSMAGLALSNPHSDEPVACLFGFTLFGGMALTMKIGTKWVLVPGCLLILLFWVLALAFSTAFVWPAATVTGLLLGCVLMIALEVASLIGTLNRYSRRTHS